MPYLIDGHNLIPKVAGLDLGELDDEMRLVELLQLFCQREHRQVEVYFDKAPPGQPRARIFGAVIARFVPEGKTADQAIQARLIRLGRAARNWTVISSDREVQAAARAHRSPTLSSESFARRLQQTLQGPPSSDEASSTAALTSDELEYWLELLNGKDSGDQNI